MYSELTTKMIEYVEEHIHDEWTLDNYANNIGYSKFHLSRLFKLEVGMTISDYIRKRRLAVASTLLLYSEESIIDIAISLLFQSQEAFTRSFKEVYGLPPGKYRKMMQSLMGMEEMNMTNEIQGWILSGTHPHLYQMKQDTQVVHTGKGSGLLECIEFENEGQFGTMMQSFSSVNYKEERIRLSCFLKTENVSKCGVWCRIDAQGKTIQFDNMDNRSITGTTDWNFYSIVLDVPVESDSIHFGVLLIGQGKVWADGFRFEIVDETVQSTNMLGIERLPKEPVNLGFDEL